jgi:hypothetical protein
VPPELLDEVLDELLELDELDPHDPGAGGAWHLQVSTLHHQPL